MTIERKEFRHASLYEVLAWLRREGLEVRDDYGWTDWAGEAHGAIIFEPAYNGAGCWLGTIRAGTVSL